MVAKCWFLTMDHHDTGRQQVRLPKVVRLLKQRDVLVWSEALLQVGQVLGLSEEVIWSISSTSPSLEAAWNARFSEVQKDMRPALLGTKAPSKKFVVVKEPSVCTGGTGKDLAEEFASSSSTPLQSSSMKEEGLTPLSDQKDQIVTRSFPMPRSMKILMGVGRREEQQVSSSSSTRFINMVSWVIEDKSKLQNRILLWRWLLNSLMSDEQVKGPYYHVVVGVDLYDVCSVYTAIKKMLNQNNIIRLAHDIKAFHKMSSAEYGGDLATYHSALVQGALVINEASANLDASSGDNTEGFRVTTFLIAAAVIEDAAKDVRYRSYLERLAEDPAKLKVLLSPDQLVGELTKYEQRILDFGGSSPQTGMGSSQPTRVAAVALDAAGCPKGGCFGFWKSGECKRGKDCKFKHVSNSKAGAVIASQSLKAEACQNCGKSKGLCPDASKCFALKLKCNWCSKIGHIASVCKAKKAGKAKVAFMSEVSEGEELREVIVSPFTALTVIGHLPFSSDDVISFSESDEVRDSSIRTCAVMPANSVQSTLQVLMRSSKSKSSIHDESLPRCSAKISALGVVSPVKSNLVKPSLPASRVVPTTFAVDSGSQVHAVMPADLPSSLTYYSPTRVCVATGSVSTMDMKADVDYKTIDGHGIGLRGSIVLPVGASENLISVSKLADVGGGVGGVTTVLDRVGVSFYTSSSFRPSGKLLGTQPRCPRTGRYVWTLYRSVDDVYDKYSHLISSVLLDASDSHMIQTLRGELTEESALCKAFLSVARTYTDLTDQYSLLHGRLSHFGPAVMKLVFPEVKIPSVVTCDCCVYSKVHKHPTAVVVDAAAQKRDMMPGELIESDFLGPFVASKGGAMYLQLFCDAGGPRSSKYLWAVPLKTKVSHYDHTPRIFSACKAQSGRALRYFKTDSDPLFASAESKEMCAKFEVLSKFSAPYEHLKHVEREGRTIMDAARTVMVAAGASAGWWAQACLHVVFVINNMNVHPAPWDAAKLVSRRNILENSKKLFDPKYFRAFGTEFVLNLPVSRREGGKGPYQARSAMGIIVGYLEDGNGWQVWCPNTKKMYEVGFSMGTSIEGRYPWRNEINKSDAEKFSPTNFEADLPALLDEEEWIKYGFSENEMSEVFNSWRSRGPNLDRFTHLLSQSKAIQAPAAVQETKEVVLKSSGKLRSESVAAPGLSVSEPAVATPPNLPKPAVVSRGLIPNFSEPTVATPANFPKPTVVSPELSAKDSEPAVAVPGLPIVESIAIPGDLVISSSKHPTVGRKVFTIEKEDGQRWRVIQVKVLPRLLNPHPTAVGHVRVCNVLDPDDIWDCDKENIDYSDAAAQVRCDASNNLPDDVTRVSLLTGMSCVDVYDCVMASVAEVPLSKPAKSVPASEAEMRACGDRIQYEKAMEEEVLELQANSTWEVIPLSSIPAKTVVLGFKWVFDKKVNQVGNVVRFKARLTAQGFRQRFGIDFFETYAGVVVLRSLRMCLVDYNQNADWIAEHWDFKNAFVQAPLDAKVYMRVPAIVSKLSSVPISSNCVLLLKKALYGLRQGSREWDRLKSSVMLKAGFQVCSRDPAFFYLRVGSAFCLIPTWVDDFFVFYNEFGRVLRDNVWALFSAVVRKVVNLGPVSWILRTAVEADRERGVLKLHQGSFVAQMLERFGMAGCVGIDTPAVDCGNDATMEAADLPTTPEAVAKVATYPIRAVVGCCWWLVSISRPDINNAVHRISKWQNQPSEKLWRWCLRLLRYLKKYPARGLVYRRLPDAPLLRAAADASLAMASSIDGRSRSILAWVVFYRGNCVSWATHFSTRICTSSSESECAALVLVVKELQCVRQFLAQYLGSDCLQGLCVDILEDNSSSIQLSAAAAVLKRSKHYEIGWDYVREAVSLREVRLVPVPTADQPADALSKPLPGHLFGRLISVIMGC